MVYVGVLMVRVWWQEGGGRRRSPPLGRLGLSQRRELCVRQFGWELNEGEIIFYKIWKYNHGDYSS